MTHLRLRRRCNAFTLIELFVVMAVITILAGLAFPVFNMVQNTAKKTQAKNDLVQIVTAVNAFYTEYGRYPVPAGTTGEPIFGGATSHRPIMDALRGAETSTTPLNPRLIIFISPPDSKDQVRAGIVTSDQQFHDPWGSAYRLRIDDDYDNQVVNPYSGSAGSAPLRLGVIAWSLGNDTTTPPATPADKNTGINKDDVISWQ